MKLSANQYQGGDIQHYKNKDAGMTIKSQKMVNCESAPPTMLVYVCVCMCVRVLAGECMMFWLSGWVGRAFFHHGASSALQSRDVR